MGTQMFVAVCKGFAGRVRIPVDDGPSFLRATPETEVTVWWAEPGTFHAAATFVVKKADLSELKLIVEREDTAADDTCVRLLESELARHCRLGPPAFATERAGEVVALEGCAALMSRLCHGAATHSEPARARLDSLGARFNDVRMNAHALCEAFWKDFA